MSDIELGRVEGEGAAEVQRAEMRFRAPMCRPAPPADYVPVFDHFMELLTKPRTCDHDSR